MFTNEELELIEELVDKFMKEASGYDWCICRDIKQKIDEALE